METRIQLTVSLGDQVVLVSVINPPTWTIGRLPDNDLVLPAPEVFQHHAEIQIETQGAVLTDLDSSSGTIVDGVRLLPNQPCLLRDGATVVIGPYVIVYRSLLIKRVDSEDSQRRVVPSPMKDELWSRRFLQNGQRNGFTDANQNSGYLRYLPIIFHDNDFLNRFLQIFEAIWEPLEQRQDHCYMYFNPRTCPASFLPWFASWFELEVMPYLPEARLRSLVAEAIELYRWRGTKYGLARMIEVCTGLKPEITETPSEPFVFRIKVRLSEDNTVSVDDIEKLIHAHKPAHTGYSLEAQ